MVLHGDGSVTLPGCTLFVKVLRLDLKFSVRNCVPCYPRAEHHVIGGVPGPLFLRGSALTPMVLHGDGSVTLSGCFYCIVVCSYPHGTPWRWFGDPFWMFLLSVEPLVAPVPDFASLEPFCRTSREAFCRSPRHWRRSWGSIRLLCCVFSTTPLPPGQVSVSSTVPTVLCRVVR